MHNHFKKYLFINKKFKNKPFFYPTTMEGNLEINEQENVVLVSISPRIYPLPVVYSAAYTFIDTCYVLIDGDPREEILVELRPKNKTDLKTIGREFNNELINYANYAAQCTRNAKLREAILKRVLLTHETQTKGSEEQTIDKWKESFVKRLEELQKSENGKSNSGQEGKNS